MSKIINSGPAQGLLIGIRSSLWFVPGIVILGLMALAFSLISVDRQFASELGRWWPEMFVTEAEGARSILSAIAGSMATVAGVVFSITIVALALASSQYTSRVLRNFMRDPTNQVMLGVFVGVYIYCLLVLRSISSVNGSFVPPLSVIGALLLAIFSSGFFIFFIHHISATIQVSEMSSAITRETLEAIDFLFPEPVGDETSETAGATIPDGTAWYSIPAADMGYIQSVDPDALVEFARKHSTVVRMDCAIGDFVAPDRPLVSVALSHPPDAEMHDALNRIYAIDSYRTIDQDVAFGIRQLVDISLKALSPGINDTTTAVTCIDHLSVILTRCAQRATPAACRYDGEVLRVIAKRPDFSYFVSLAFNQIQENAKHNTEVLLRMLSALEHIAGFTYSKARIAVLREQVDAIDEASSQDSVSSIAQTQIQQSLARARLRLDQQENTGTFQAKGDLAI